MFLSSGGENPLAEHNVELGHSTFNRPITEATLKRLEAYERERFAKNLTNYKISFAPYSGLGVTALYYTFSATFKITLPAGVTLPKSVTLPSSETIVYEGLVTLQGKTSYEASINNNTLPKSQLGTLVHMAMSALG